MKNECNVVKDLMPLCIDGVASEESQRMVEGHLEECEECAKAYADMHDELEQQMILENEKKEMEVVAKQLHARRIRKAVMSALLGLLAAVLIFLVAYHADEIAFRMKYVHWNGDLREEALFAKVSGDPYDEGMRYVHLSSSPSGSPDYEFIFESEILEDGKSWCLQVRAKYKGWNTEEYDAGGIFCYGGSEDGVWVGYSGEEYGYLPVSRVELLSGNTATVLWEVGDEVPTQREVLNEEQVIQDSMQNKLKQ